MFYQVTATFFFDESDEANDFYHDCAVALPKATVVNPGQPNQECSRVVMLECRHDEHPVQPCEHLQEADNCPL